MRRCVRSLLRVMIWAVLFVYGVFGPTTHALAAYAKSALTFDGGRSYGIATLRKYEYAINVMRYVNTSPCRGKVVFMIHGFGDNSGIFEPLAIQLINNGKACQVYAMDLPAHGNSTVSTDPYFGPAIWGQIDVNDYTLSAEQVLIQLYNMGIRVNTLVGHSTGGLVIQRLQNKYISESTSLKGRFGIENTVLIASDIPRDLPWASGDAPISAGYAKGLVVSLAQTSPAPYGEQVPLDYNTYIALKYSANGTPVSGAPSTQKAYWLNDPEPYAAAANITGLDETGTTTNTAPRLYVAPGIWAGFNLTVVWPSQDLFFQESEMDGLANFLKPGTTAVVISDPEAIHAIQYTKPGLLLSLF